MKVPIIPFKAGGEFETTVVITGEEAEYIVEEKLGIDDTIVLQDELGIQYVSKIIAASSSSVIVEICNLVDDVQRKSNDGLMGRLSDIRGMRKRASDERRRLEDEDFPE